MAVLVLAIINSPDTNTQSVNVSTTHTDIAAGKL